MLQNHVTISMLQTHVTKSCYKFHVTNPCYKTMLHIFMLQTHVTKWCYTSCYKFLQHAFCNTTPHCVFLPDNLLLVKENFSKNLFLGMSKHHPKKFWSKKFFWGGLGGFWILGFVQNGGRCGDAIFEPISKIPKQAASRDNFTYK